MKTYGKTLSLLFITTLLWVSCKEESIPSDQEAFINKIARKWTIDQSSIVTLDGVDITDAWQGFELTIHKDLTYTANGQSVKIDPFPWPSSGSFALKDTLAQFTRDDGLILSIVVDNNGQLILEYQYEEGYDAITAGSLKGIRGKWKMKCSK